MIFCEQQVSRLNSVWDIKELRMTTVIPACFLPLTLLGAIGTAERRHPATDLLAIRAGWPKRVTEEF
jgi:hypothetical protein